MPRDLPEYFAALRGAADGPILRDAAGIRMAGDRRRTVRRAATVVAAALVVSGIAGTAVALGRGPDSPPPVTTSPTPSAAEPTTPPSPTSPPSAPPSVAAAGPDCSLADLDPAPLYGGEGAAGSAYLVVVVRNRGTRACQLGGYPVLRWQDGTVPLTQGRDDPDPPPVVVRPGEYAHFTIRVPNARGCGRVVRYPGVRVVLPGGAEYPLPRFDLTWDCGPGGMLPWEPGKPPVPDPYRTGR